MSSIFDGIINDGVFMNVGDCLMVEAGEGMTISVKEGRAWFNHTWTLNDAELPITVSESELVLDRIDAVVLEVNAGETVRANSIKMVTGVPSSYPERPTLEDSTYIHQHALAYIYVAKGVTEITQANITNVVGGDETPFITGILETASLDTLLSQWRAQLDEFVAGEEACFSEWSRKNRIEFEKWSDTQKQDYENWSDTQKQDYLTWISDQMSSEEEWIQSMRNTFLIWFDEMQTQLSGDVAGNLQLQIDKEEVKRILLSGFSDGSKAFNEDGTVIVSTADDGRTLTKTFTNNFLTMTTVLKSSEGGEIARMVKQFDADGTLIEITTTYA
jgi:hypothetical protein